MEIFLPPSQHDAFSVFAHLDRSQLSKLSNAFSTARLTTDPNVLDDRVADKVGLSSDDAHKLVAMFGSMQMFCTANEVSGQDFTDSIIGSVLASGKPDLLEVDISDVRATMVAIFDHTAFQTVVKAMDLAVEHQSVYNDARVLTDVRPVFTTSTSQGPPAAMIVHTLRLTYDQKDGSKELFLAMDADDLALLIDSLERAQEKETNLRAQLAGIFRLFEHEP